MGTNFYWHKEKECEHCGNAPERLHIGKSSMGWCFGLHVIPEEGINNLDSWVEKWYERDSYIMDEYGEKVVPSEMIMTIKNRGRPEPARDDFDYVANCSVPGPNNLVRRKIGDYCIGHGEGTWDLVPGEFS